MRWPERVSGLGTVKDSASVAASLSQAAIEGRLAEAREDVILLAGGQAEERVAERGPDAKEPARAFGWWGGCGRRRGERMDSRHGTVLKALRRKALQGMSQMRRRPQKRRGGRCRSRGGRGN